MELSSARGSRIFSRPLVYVFSAVLLVRLVALLHMAGSPVLIPSYGDMRFYDDWARRIVTGEMGEPLVFRRQFWKLIVLLSQQGVVFAEFGLSPALNQQRCHEGGHDDDAREDYFEFCHGHRPFMPTTTR